MKKTLLLTIPLLFTLNSYGSDKGSESYIEYCAGTKYQALHYGDGNPMGHALVYVEGLCKDQDKDYPQVKVCDKRNNHTGVGISLDADFENVSWIAVPTRELTLFDGVNSKVDKVDDQTVDQIVQKVREYNVFENVKMNDTNFPQVIKDEKDINRRYSLYALGTDLAFNTARTMYCAKVKVEKNQLTKVAKFLNEENDKYYNTDKSYEWSTSDNCTHLAVNTLAHGNIVKAKKTKTKRNLLGTILTLTIPKPELLKIARVSNKSIYNPRRIWNYKKHRNFFLENSTLPWSPGNLVTKYDMAKDEENEYYKSEGATFFGLPVFGMSLKKILKGKYANKESNYSLHSKKINKALESSMFKKTYKSVQKQEFINEYRAYLISLLNSIK